MKTWKWKKIVSEWFSRIIKHSDQETRKWDGKPNNYGWKDIIFSADQPVKCLFQIVAMVEQLSKNVKYVSKCRVAN